MANHQLQKEADRILFTEVIGADGKPFLVEINGRETTKKQFESNPNNPENCQKLLEARRVILENVAQNGSRPFEGLTDLVCRCCIDRGSCVRLVTLAHAVTLLNELHSTCNEASV